MIYSQASTSGPKRRLCYFFDKAKICAAVYEARRYGVGVAGDVGNMEIFQRSVGANRCCRTASRRNVNSIRGSEISTNQSTIRDDRGLLLGDVVRGTATSALPDPFPFDCSISFLLEIVPQSRLLCFMACAASDFYVSPENMV